MRNCARAGNNTHAENRTDEASNVPFAERSSRLSHCGVLLLAVLPRSRSRGRGVCACIADGGALSAICESTGADDELSEAWSRSFFQRSAARDPHNRASSNLPRAASDLMNIIREYRRTNLFEARGA